MPFTLRNLKEDLEDLGSRFDGSPDLEFRLATEALELEQSGLSYQRVPPGAWFLSKMLGRRHTQVFWNDTCRTANSYYFRPARRRAVQGLDQSRRRAAQRHLRPRRLPIHANRPGQGRGDGPVSAHVEIMSFVIDPPLPASATVSADDKRKLSPLST